jgi:STE24 endopeptidase
MQFIFILIICLACLPLRDESTPAPDLFFSFGGTLLVMTLVALAADLPSRWFARQLYRWPSDRRQILRRYNRWRLVHGFLNLGGYLVTRIYFCWGNVVRIDFRLDNSILLGEIFILAPLLTTLVAAWMSYYRVDRALYETSTAYGKTTFWSNREYLSFHLRHYLGLVFAILVLLFGTPKVLHALVPDVEQQPWFPLVQLAVYGGGAILLMPWLLTVVWSTRSLPKGELRDRLEAAARRLHFRYTDIRLWNTHGGVANAMVTGILPYPRYVLLSDHLLQNLTPDQIEAVFGHEVGHVKHFHMPLYLAFFVLSMTLLGFASKNLQFQEIVNSTLPANEWFTRPGFLSETLGVGGLAFGYFWLVFGFLSRRCERQADVHGCKSVAENGFELTPAGIQTFVTALERVADLNGIRRDRPSWLHSSIARRVAFLQSLLRDPSEEHRFHRRLAVIKWSVFLGLLGVVVVCGFTVGWDALLQ